MMQHALQSVQINFTIEDMAKALITGISGQDGIFLARLLIEEGYEVHGTLRPAQVESFQREISGDSSLETLKTLPLNLDNCASVFHLLVRNEYDYCYHLAAQSYVAEGLADGFQTMTTNISGTHFILAALRDFQPSCRFFLAGSSEMFGSPPHSPQNEKTLFQPRNPYGISKLAAYHLAKNYRGEHGMFCSTGILYNHESPRRGTQFVTRKITSSVARIKRGKQKKLELGRLDAERDWGWAEDYVKAMKLIIEAKHPRDYIVATGKLHSVAEFCQIAFAYAGLDWEDHVVVSPKFVRLNEPVTLCGDFSAIKKDLGWEPNVDFKEMVHRLVEFDLKNTDS